MGKIVLTLTVISALSLCNVVVGGSAGKLSNLVDFLCIQNKVILSIVTSVKLYIKYNTTNNRCYAANLDTTI